MPPTGTTMARHLSSVGHTLWFLYQDPL
jgi:hypothetical protein